MAKTYDIQLRFADIDAMGHVNNANFLHYFESARLKFFSEHFPDWNWREKGILLAKNEVEYLKPLELIPTIQVELAVSRIGNKSFDLIYKVIDQKNQDFARGLSVIVCFDYKQNESIRIPDPFLELLKNHLIDKSEF